MFLTSAAAPLAYTIAREQQALAREQKALAEGEVAARESREILVQQQRAAEDELAGEERRRVDLAARAVAVANAPARRRDAMEQLVPALRAKAAAAEATQSVHVLRRLPPAPAGPNGNVYFPELIHEPEYARSFATHTLNRERMRYAGFLQTLDDATREDFERVLVERRFAALDLESVALAEGLSVRPLAGSPVARQRFQAVREFMAQAERALGQEHYAEFQRFERTIGVQGVVEDLEQRLSYSNQPLSAAQARAVADLLVEHGREFPPPATSVHRISDAFFERAAAILSPDQLARLQALRDEHVEAQESARRERSAREAAAPGSR